ncbi:MAG: HAMP domain-containing histidine kinase [Actinobacteria bacterium]|nr:HAMP domain-containing histidine kinase [Actinomycetota bacterium]
MGFALAVFGVSAVSLLAFVDPIPHEAIASGLYLVVVVAVVAVGRLLPALVAALLSFLALAYWFSPPPGKLTPEPEDLIALVEFLLVGLLVSQLLAAGARSRERLAEQNSQLRDLDQLRDDFVALVSHELRTPLTSIRGYLELLHDEGGSLSTEQRRSLETIERNVGRLMTLVNDLLTMLQLRTRTLEIEKMEFDVYELLETAVAAAAPLAEKQGIELCLRAGPLPSGLGDRARVGQLVDNLISNAVKYTLTGGRVEVGAESDGESVRIAVCDTGLGMSENDLERLFEPFVRGTSAVRAEVPGVGLGLAISQSIAHAHGSSIEVESVEGVGTTFAFRLPAGD